MTDELKGLKILVTRPARQADQLCALITKAGGVPIRLPAMEIRPITGGMALHKILSGLCAYDYAIFISRNAVSNALSLVQGKIPERLKIIALGEGTAADLIAAGMHVDAHGGSQAGSETLLDLPLLQETAVRNRKIVIFRGAGGRELLGETLRARGATVEYAEVYERVSPRHEKTGLDKIWHENRPDWMIITSSEALNNLFAMLVPEHRVIMLDTRLVVIGERTAALAQASGFKWPAVVADATDAGLLQALIQEIRSNI